MQINENISYRNFIRSGFRAELVPSSRKINAERRALMKKEIQVSRNFHTSQFHPSQKKFTPASRMFVVFGTCSQCDLWFRLTHFYDFFIVSLLTPLSWVLELIMITLAWIKAWNCIRKIAKKTFEKSIQFSRLRHHVRPSSALLWWRIIAPLLKCASFICLLYFH